MVETTQRAASLNDFKDIWGLMGRVAADVPFDFKSEAEQESVLSELMACCISGAAAQPLLPVHWFRLARS